MELHLFFILLLCSGAFGCGYNHDLSVSVPKLEALSGSCLLIPCTFTPAPQHQGKLDLNKPVVAIWSQNAPNLGRAVDPVLFNSATPSSTSPMTMIGDLQQKNCTTLFSDINTSHSDKFYLRIQNHEFRATDLCDPLQITVRDSPWSPTLQVSGSQREQGTVTISCSALTPCPHSAPRLTWNLHQPPHNTLPNPDGTFSTSIQHNMTLSEEHHGLEVQCSAVYPVTGGQKRAESVFSLSVDYAPKDTSLWLTNTSLSVGQCVSLSCSSRARPPVHSFSWFRITSQGPHRVHEGPDYSFIFNRTTQGEYFCQAKNPVGEQNSAVIRIHSALSENNVSWRPIAGGAAGLLILGCIAGVIGCVISKRRAPKDAETELYEEGQKQDSVLYGEVVFSKSAPKRSGPVQQAEEPEDTVYSEVRVREAAGGNAEATPDVYATVKKR